MAQLSGNTKRASVSNVFGPVCLCDGCTQQGRCRDYQRHARDSVFAWINGYECTCSDYQPVLFRGLEGVRP